LPAVRRPFFSKDAVLMAAASGTVVSPHTTSNPYIFGLPHRRAAHRVLYGRLVIVAFFGKARTHEAEHGHDGPAP